MEVKIYVLKDPITLEIRYVGKTNSIKTRFCRHLSHARNLNNKRHIDNWIRSINNNPIIEIIELCTEENWKDREIYWIKYYRDLKTNLCNHSDGGEGAGYRNKNCVGKKHTDATKQKIREATFNRSDDIKKHLSDIGKQKTLSKNNNAKKVIHINSNIEYGSLKEACLIFNLNYSSEVNRIMLKRKTASFKYKIVN